MSEDNPAEVYERLFVPALSKPWADDLLRRAEVRPGERVLDVACGTGIVARKAAARVGPTGRVVGVDPLPPMLEVAGRCAAAEGLSIEWIHGRAEQLPVPDAAFDLVCCQVGMMFFDDKALAAREMRRALAPGGRVAISVPLSVEHQGVYADLDKIIERHLGVPTLARTLFSYGDRSTLRSVLDQAGFVDIAIETLQISARVRDVETFLRLELEDALDFGAPRLEGKGKVAREAAIEALRTEADEVLDSHMEDGALVVRPQVHVALARAAQNATRRG